MSGGLSDDSVKDFDIVGEMVERRMDEVQEHYKQTMKKHDDTLESVMVKQNKIENNFKHNQDTTRKIINNISEDIKAYIIEVFKKKMEECQASMEPLEQAFQFKIEMFNYNLKNVKTNLTILEDDIESLQQLIDFSKYEMECKLLETSNAKTKANLENMIENCNTGHNIWNHEVSENKDLEKSKRNLKEILKGHKTNIEYQ